MRIGILSAMIAVSSMLAGCQHLSKEESEARLKAEGISIISTADMPRDAAKTQIAKFVARARNYPESYVISGFINPRITNARISGPYEDPPPFSKGTYYCVSYTTDRPLIPALVSLRAYPAMATSNGKKIVENITIATNKFACDTPYEPFPELEKRRDEIIDFRRSHPGELKDSIAFGMGQL